MRRLLMALVWISVAATPRLAWAQVTPAAGYVPPDDTQAIRTGAVIFYDFTSTTSPKSSDADGNKYAPSVFNVGRAYVNITGNVSHIVVFRITPDIARETGTGSSLNGSLTFRVKYAYAQLNLDQWTNDWKSTYVRLGIQQTPYIDYTESIYRYRFQGTVFVEREGFLTSSDGGASFHTNLPNNLGDVHIGLFNGEGYSRAEANDQKALQVRGTLRPFARTSSLLARGLRVTAFYDNDHYLERRDRKRFVFNTMFEHAHLNLGVDYLDAKDQTSGTAARIEGRGWSVFATPFFKAKGDGLEGFLRFDRFKPNVDLSGQERQRSIVGVAYWFPHPGGAATAALLLDYEQLKFSGFPGTAANATQQRIALHGLINF